MEDTIKLPLDADGVPLRLWDVVFVKNEEKPEARRVTSLLFHSSPEGCMVGSRIFGGPEEYWSAENMTHTKPDTWEDIDIALSRLANCHFTAKEAKEEVALVMERIKRMVEL